MHFYMTPGSCSTGIHILLEELEHVFQVTIVNLLAGDQHQEAFLAVNPKATIPVLVTDQGTPITEFQAIAYWLAQSSPRAKLFPETLEQQVRVMEIMDYVVSTIHMQGFTRIFTTQQYSDDPALEESIKARGKEIVNRGFAVINTWLPEKGYALGAFSIADAALFYVEFWAGRTGIELPPRCAAHYQLMLERPKVQQVLREEGYQVR